MNKVVDLKGRTPYVKALDKSPKPLSELPKQPKKFPKVPKQVWEELAPQLLEAGLLTNVDGIAFGLLCKDIADLEKVEAKLVKIDEWVDTTPNGFMVQSVWLNIRNRLHDDILKLCKEFGMTPSSRSTIKTNTANGVQGSLFDETPDNSEKPKGLYANFGARVQH